jgi:peptidoglycan/LPS O-acetylase OafA/YrhL
MKLHIISLINGIILMIFGIWSHLWPESPSPTALIPLVFGAAILVLNKGVRNYRKAISNTVMVLTFLILVGLIFPLTGSIERGDTPALIRVIIMMAASLFSFIFFVKRFINDRFNPNKEPKF